MTVVGFARQPAGHADTQAWPDHNQISTAAVMAGNDVHRGLK